jgi:membrane protease YdiL (CAAX protease family)
MLPLFIPFTTLLSIVYLVLFQQSGGSLLPAVLLHASTDLAPRVIDISRVSWRFWLVADCFLLLVVITLCVVGHARNNIGREKC